MPISQSAFVTAANAFVKAAGTESNDGMNLKAVPSLAGANYCESYHLVKKRIERNLVFRKKVHLIPTEYTLDKILEEDKNETPVKVELKMEKFGSFELSQTFDAKGKSKVSLFNTEVGAGVSAGCNAHLTMNLGEVVVEALDIHQLKDMIQNRKVDMKKGFIKNVIQKKETLCIIVASYKVKEDAIITKLDKSESSAHADIPVEAPATIDIHVEGSMAYRRQSKVGIPSGKPIAYSMREILVSSDHSMGIQDPGDEGGFRLQDRSAHFCSSENTHFLPSVIRRNLKPILTLPGSDLSGVRTILIELLKRPEVLASLNITFREACDCLNYEGGMKTTQEEFQEGLGIDDLGVINTLLKVTGFTIEEDTVIYPISDDGSILTCTSDLLDSLASLDKDHRGIFYDEVSPDEQMTMLEMVQTRCRGGCGSVTAVSSGEPIETPLTKLSLLLETADSLTSEKILTAMCALWG